MFLIKRKTGEPARPLIKRMGWLAIGGLALTILVNGCKHEPILPPKDNGKPIDTTGQGGGGGSSCSPDTVYFEQTILPLIISNCA